MTGETPRRTLSGLTPKAATPQGNARLLRRNRQTPNPAPADPKTAQTQTLPAPAHPGSTEQPAATAAAEPQRPAKAGGKTKLGFYIDVDDAARLRGAAKYIPNELRAQGIDGFSALAARLIMDGLAELERHLQRRQALAQPRPGRGTAPRTAGTAVGHQPGPSLGAPAPLRCGGFFMRFRISLRLS
ncbi:hypothetical protein [Georgenia daeguensis]|uniref:Centromere-binding protein ParB C-terminal domain-containing protein n=1 Tax=Georgenia daeguensis TaxID=908355 RepID=A0ABP6UM00_9MICO